MIRRTPFVLVGCEPELDSNLGAEALEALGKADKVVCLTSFASDAMKRYADVLLPIAPLQKPLAPTCRTTAPMQSFAGVDASARRNPPRMEGAACSAICWKQIFVVQ